MKILVDVSAGQAVRDALIALGFDVQSVRDRDPRMPDQDILEWAVRDNRLVVTMDKDFGELVFRSGKGHSGVLLLRMEGARASEKAAIATGLFSQFGDQLSGRFSVYQDGRIRIR